jgi:hypothetical protein
MLTIISCPQHSQSHEKVGFRGTQFFGKYLAITVKKREHYNYTSASRWQETRGHYVFWSTPFSGLESHSLPVCVSISAASEKCLT